MWLVELPNPNKIEQCWECTFLKVCTQVITKIASKFFFTVVPLRKPRLSKMASIKTNKIKKKDATSFYQLLINYNFAFLSKKILPL